jgi:hypothetical protein
MKRSASLAHVPRECQAAWHRQTRGTSTHCPSSQLKPRTGHSSVGEGNIDSLEKNVNTPEIGNEKNYANQSPGPLVSKARRENASASRDSSISRSPSRSARLRARRSAEWQARVDKPFRSLSRAKASLAALDSRHRSWIDSGGSLAFRENPRPR